MRRGAVSRRSCRAWRCALSSAHVHVLVFHTHRCRGRIEVATCVGQSQSSFFLSLSIHRIHNRTLRHAHTRTNTHARTRTHTHSLSSPSAPHIGISETIKPRAALPKMTPAAALLVQGWRWHPQKSHPEQRYPHPRHPRHQRNHHSMPRCFQRGHQRSRPTQSVPMAMIPMPMPAPPQR